MRGARLWDGRGDEEGCSVGFALVVTCHRKSSGARAISPAARRRQGQMMQRTSTHPIHDCQARKVDTSTHAIGNGRAGLLAVASSQQQPELPNSKPPTFRVLTRPRTAVIFNPIVARRLFLPRLALRRSHDCKEPPDRNTRAPLTQRRAARAIERVPRIPRSISLFLSSPASASCLLLSTVPSVAFGVDIPPSASWPRPCPPRAAPACRGDQASSPQDKAEASAIRRYR